MKDTIDRQRHLVDTERPKRIRQESYQRMRADIMSNAYAAKTEVQIKPTPVEFTAHPSPFNKHMQSDGKATDFVLAKSAIKLVDKWDENSARMKIPHFMEDAPSDKRKRIKQVLEEFNKKRFATENHGSALKRMIKERESERYDSTQEIIRQLRDSALRRA